MYLLDKNDNEILKFYVDLGRLSFLGKKLSRVSIYYYPIIIFEFMTGFFTTEELFEKNREFGSEFSTGFEIMEIPKDLSKTLKIGATKSSNVEAKENKINTPQINSPTKDQQNEAPANKKAINPDTKSYNVKSEEFRTKLENVYQNQLDKKNSTKTLNGVAGGINETVATKAEQKENPQKSIIVETKKKKDSTNTDKKATNNDNKLNKTKLIPYFKYIQSYQMLIYLINPQENIKESNPNFGKKLEIFQDEMEKHKRKLRIIEMERELEFLNKKNEIIKELNKDLEDTIKDKKESLEKVKEQLKPNQINYNNKLSQLKNNLSCRGQYQLIYDSFIYQKMAEVCFVFFNNKIQSLYTIPKFYNEPLSYRESNKMERLEYYNAEKKNISSMLGHICQLLIYLSKTFNIPLRFPIFLNGSRSYILRSVRDKVFLPLYFEAKKDDKHGNFESALNCLKDDIKEIFNFLAMFPEIISKTDNENVNNMNGKYLFFFFFVIFNHSLFRFMKTLQNAV